MVHAPSFHCALSQSSPTSKSRDLSYPLSFLSSNVIIMGVIEPCLSVGLLVCWSVGSLPTRTMSFIFCFFGSDSTAPPFFTSKSRRKEACVEWSGVEGEKGKGSTVNKRKCSDLPHGPWGTLQGAKALVPIWRRSPLCHLLFSAFLLSNPLSKSVLVRPRSKMRGGPGNKENKKHKRTKGRRKALSKKECRIENKIDGRASKCNR